MKEKHPSRTMRTTKPTKPTSHQKRKVKKSPPRKEGSPIKPKGVHKQSSVSHISVEELQSIHNQLRELIHKSSELSKDIIDKIYLLALGDAFKKLGYETLDACVNETVKSSYHRSTINDYKNVALVLIDLGLLPSNNIILRTLLELGINKSPKTRRAIWKIAMEICKENGRQFPTQKIVKSAREQYQESKDYSNKKIASNHSTDSTKNDKDNSVETDKNPKPKTNNKEITEAYHEPQSSTKHSKSTQNTSKSEEVDRRSMTAKEALAQIKNYNSTQIDKLHSLIFPIGKVEKFVNEISLSMNEAEFNKFKTKVKQLYPIEA